MLLVNNALKSLYNEKQIRLTRLLNKEKYTKILLFKLKKVFSLKVERRTS